MLYLIYLLILVSATLLGLSLINPTLSHSPLTALKLNDSTTAPAIKRPLFFKSLGFLIPLNKLIVNRMGRRKIENRLLAANAGLLPEDFIALKEILLILSIGFLIIFKGLFTGKELIWLVIFAGASLICPDLWLKMRISNRQKMIIKTLPDVIDLLSLCVNAGLDFGVAVKWVMDKSKPTPLIEELGLFLMETKVGKPRRQALEDMAKRIDLPEVYSFSRALIQTERLGTPVESALSVLAEEVRETRFRRGERLALQAPIKMLFPLIFFIMPVVGIIVGGPVLLQFLQGGIPGFK